MAKADRIVWAVKTLAVRPRDQVLEIGCGHGHAVSLICDELKSGVIVAVDQSEKMIQQARKNNAEHVASGRVVLLATPFHEADLDPYEFDKIFAVNVNAFWMKGVRELVLIKEKLRRGGKIFLFNQPPARGKIKDIMVRTRENVLAAGLVVEKELISDHKPVPVCCVIAR